MARKRIGRPTKDPKRATIQIRLSKKLLNRARGLARLYAGGSLSRWIRHGMENAPRKFLK